MKKIILTLLCGALLLAACKQKSKDATGDQAQTVQASGADSSAIREVITDFYNWYNNHFSSFFRFDLYNGINQPDQPPYKIEWEGVKKYQQFITDSVPQLGRQFLENQKRFFERCDSAFKVDTTDDIPYGFDYDWFTNSQESPEYLVNDLNNPKSTWDIRMNADVAEVSIHATREMEGKTEDYEVIRLVMQKENGRWKIAKIGTEERP